MKYMLDLQERIYDPELGEGVSSTEYIFEKYCKLKDSVDYFISFTKIDKLGINPRSEHDTPLGIYTYPINEFFTEYVFGGRYGRYSDETKRNILNQKIGRFAPFAGENPHVWVVKVNRNTGRFIEDISKTYTKNDYENDIEWLIENADRQMLSKTSKVTRTEIYHIILNILYKRGIIASIDQGKKEYSKGKAFEYIIDNEEVKYDVLRYMIKNYSNASKFPDSFGGKIWSITRLIVKENPVKWNALWRDMGYIGVADRSGVGIIHENENIQAIFFSVKGFKVVDKIQNIEASQGRIVDKRKIKDKISTNVDLFALLSDKITLDLLEKQILKFDNYLSKLTKKEFEIAEGFWDEMFDKYLIASAGGSYEKIEEVVTELQREKKLNRIVVMYGGDIRLTYRE